MKLFAICGDIRWRAEVSSTKAPVCRRNVTEFGVLLRLSRQLIYSSVASVSTFKNMRSDSLNWYFCWHLSSVPNRMVSRESNVVWPVSICHGHFCRNFLLAFRISAQLARIIFVIFSVADTSAILGFISLGPLRCASRRLPWIYLLSACSDWSPVLTTLWLPSGLSCCWLDRLVCKNRPRNDR